MNIGGFQIGVAGSHDARDDPFLLELAGEIGTEIMRRGHRLITGGCSGGLTQICARSARDWLQDHERDDEQHFRITSILADQENLPETEIGRDLIHRERDRKRDQRWDRDRRRAYMASFRDALITIAGRENTRREGQCAFCAGTPVIPIFGTEGNSRLLWKQIQDEFSEHVLYKDFITSDEWRALEQTKGAKETAEHAVELAIRMARNKVRLHDGQIRKRRGAFKVFLILPFKPKDDFNTITGSLKSIFSSEPLLSQLGGQIKCIDGSDVLTGRLDISILTSIDEADLLVADLTGNNENVFLECGYAIAQGKNVLFISQNPGKTSVDLQNAKQIPFDLKSLSQREDADLKLALQQAIKEVLNHEEIGDRKSCAGANKYATCEAVKNGFPCQFRKEWPKRLEFEL